MVRPVKSMSFARQPLDAILAGTGSLRVMRALLAHGGAIPVSRIAQDTALTPDGVRGVLRDLERTGIVKELGSGRTRFYQVISDHPIAVALDALFAAERVRFEDIIASVTTAAKDIRIVAAWLFGSVARGEDTSDSDLDVALVISAKPGEVDPIADQVRDLLQEHERRLGFTASIVSIPLADLRRLSSEGSPLWSDLQKDVRALKGGPPERVLREAISFSANKDRP